MKTQSPHHAVSPTILHKVIIEAKKALTLTLYFGTWFCAITLLILAVMHKHVLPETVFVLAYIKAALCAKFILIGQAVSPISIDKHRGILRSLLANSLIYLAIVLSLSWLESGVDGLIHGKAFIESLRNFGEGDPFYISTLAIVYWLILWPVLIFVGLNQALGKDVTSEILFGPCK